jgi:hypothetical protein
VSRAAFGSAPKDENSPPPEGCREWVVGTGKNPPLKAEAFYPLPRRAFSREPKPLSIGLDGKSSKNKIGTVHKPLPLL